MLREKRRLKTDRFSEWLVDLVDVWPQVLGFLLSFLGSPVDLSVHKCLKSTYPANQTVLACLACVAHLALHRQLKRRHLHLILKKSRVHAPQLLHLLLLQHLKPLSNCLHVTFHGWLLGSPTYFFDFGLFWCLVFFLKLLLSL